MSPITHAVRHVPWDLPETRPAMADAADRRPGLALTSRSLWRDGRRWIPVTGELHYSRLSRSRWREALRLMRAGGISVVSTYVFWIHHQEHQDREPLFDGDLDVAAFVRLCRDTGLEVIVRVGPWCHGEVRNGGLPDWVEPARRDDPAYLAKVRRWFGSLGRELGGLCGPGGPIIGIQLENELYDQRDHLVTLKGLARESGLHAPLWTATAWGSADIPVGEVFPLYGGYADGFWVDTADGWHDSFRTHFHFSHQWDDPGIGKDLAGDKSTGIPGAKHPDFPAATCELGGGMATAYHRRPWPSGADIAAVALCKLGSGSAWQGYYMYAGGTNPRPGLQESHATGYPNDLPEYNYDFHAPIGAHLQTRDSFHLLRNQHAFLAAFGDRLAGMNATIPGALDVHDRETLRWSLRSDGRAGFVFVNTHQPHDPLPAHPGVRFDVTLDEARVVFPHRPVDLPTGTFVCWPVRLGVRGVTVNWATMQILTLLEGADPVLVLAKADGVPGHLSLPAGSRVSGHPVLERDGEVVLEDLPGARKPLTVETPDGARLRLLVLDAADARRAWTPGGRLVLSEAGIVETEDGGLAAICAGPATAELFDGDAFERYDLDGPREPVPVKVVRTAEATPPPARPITVPGRASAPDADTLAACAARYTITVPTGGLAGERVLLRLDLVGDVAVARIGDRTEDLFWDGAPWDIDLTPAVGAPTVEVEVLIYPLDADTLVRLPERAEEQRKGLSAHIVSATVIDHRTVPVTPPDRRS
ncbi:Glycosyl hydrolases family 35 [Nonomuraea solani]|uniref:Glycosyl hydrolases family 35 n=1 Tax=Nonomuraea solani TaxID=1144553 RepID=A0A1H6DRD3_9ACTN|nr:beta-galactosidase [Nonomuraea solani]SEG87839.1 Glycosyl hydrolases family 35 [Nonomuraea solani]